MNPRWGVRIAGIMLVLALLFALMYIQRQLAELAREKGVDTTTTSR